MKTKKITVIYQETEGKPSINGKPNFGSWKVGASKSFTMDEGEDEVMLRRKVFEQLRKEVKEALEELRK